MKPTTNALSACIAMAAFQTAHATTIYACAAPAFLQCCNKNTQLPTIGTTGSIVATDCDNSPDAVSPYRFGTCSTADSDNTLALCCTSQIENVSELPD